MSHDLKLGQIIEGAANRDATHIAVAPVFSKERLAPGMHVGLVSGSSTEVSAIGTHIGIVDPFLVSKVEPGEKFYLFLYPQTVTGLRHEWTHPAFADKAGFSPDDRAMAEAWLRNFAAQWRIGYERMVSEAMKAGSICAGTDLIRDELGGDEAEFWKNMETLSGQTFTESHRERTDWRCAC